jgi:hypothetical protein
LAQSRRDPTFQKLLRSPDDPELNLRFAQEAEARGDLRHALAALERARIARPDDPMIAAEFERVRRLILPTVTAFTVEAGAAYATNPTRTSNSSDARKEALLSAGVAVEDERTVAGFRLRSFASAFGEWHTRNHDLSTGEVMAGTGPVFALSPDLAVHIAPSVSNYWLDGDRLYTELGGALRFSSVLLGLTQTMSFGGGWRHGNEDRAFADSRFFEVSGRFVTPGVRAGDIVHIQPRYIWNKSESDSLAAPVQPSREVTSLSFQEWGGRIAYYMPFFNEQVYVGAGFVAFGRRYEVDALTAAGVVQGEKRFDTFLEPSAHLVFPRLIAETWDVRVDYRHEINRSNDAFSDYRNQVVGLKFVGTF